MKAYRTTAVAVLALLAGACATAPVPENTGPADEPVTPEPQAPARPDPAVRVGVILTASGSGTLRQYGDAILEGVRVGADAAATGQREVELVVEDDGGTDAGAAAAVQRLEQRGIRAIVGPLTEEGLRAAANARSSDRVALISPMAVSDPDGLRNVYAMNVVDGTGAAALGEYARRYERVGVLHARTADGERQAKAFIDAYGSAGALTRSSYQSGSANLSTELSRLRNARVQAVYAPGSDRELQIVLPQIAYSGLSSAQILGNDSYIGDGARGLPQQVVQGAIIATSLLRDSDEVGWRDFVAAYEARYRRSLQTAIPALGYDAVRLAAALAAGETEVAGYRGATGVITLRNDAISRRPFLVRMDAGRLIRVN